jgi:peptidoglycan-N-acetylglucosamine deacetylase
VGTAAMWPNGATCGATITVHFDAETLWTSRDDDNRQRPSVLSQGAFGARVGVDELLRVFRRHALRTTFFVPGFVAERYPEVVARIAEAGHAFGHHGYEHERLAPDDPVTEEEILVRGIECLTAVCGTRPVGYCAPGWQFTPHTLRLLAKHGFRYSTNLMDDIRPYVHTVGGDRIVELPVHWLLDDAPFRLFDPSTANKLEPMSVVSTIWREELEGIRDAGGLFNLTLHPQISGRPSAAWAVDDLVGYLRSLPDLWIGTCEDLATHWLSNGG